MQRQSALRAALGARYRAWIPVGIRKRVRKALGRDGSRRPPDPTLRFDLVMPDDGRPRRGGRRSVHIEAARNLWMPRHLQKPGLAFVEPETMAVLLALIESTPVGAIYDVGANAGPLAIVGPALFERDFVAFEPAPDVCGALRDIVTSNWLRCIVETMAVGDAVGVTTLYLSQKSDLSNSLREGFRETVGTVEVPVTTLDAYAAKSGLWPSILKIDTETTEAAVLRGGTDVLGRRPWIVCEVLPDWSESEIMAVLEPFHYRFYRIEDSVPFQETGGIVADPETKHRNWLFAPDAPSAAQWEGIARWRTAIDATRAA